MVGAFGAGFHVRCQLPLSVSEYSEPEPDFAVVPRGEDWARHPPSAPLVIEVSDPSLDRDRGEKASLYALAGVAEYWVVNLVQRQVEIYTEPMQDPAARWRFSYRMRRIVKEGETLRPLHLPAVDLAVSDLLPQGSQVGSGANDHNVLAGDVPGVF
ncbi:MAG: Uma2 family endonuclease [Candidatus Eremiobacterota bacterium]